MTEPKTTKTRFPKLQAILGAVAFAALVLAGAQYQNVLKLREQLAPTTVKLSVEKKIRKNFPKTKFVEFNVTEFGLIEGVTASNIIYFTTDGSYAFIGEVLDVENKRAITSDRRESLNKFGDLDNIGKTETPTVRPNAPVAQAGPSAPLAVADMTGFPEANMIVHNKGAGKVLYLVSDYNCSWCKKQNAAFRNITDIEIREIPVAFLSEDSVIFGAHALCSDDQVSTSHALFDGDRSNITTCTEGTASVQSNTEWAKQLGITGTPALITVDGKISSGFRDITKVRALLAEMDT